MQSNIPQKAFTLAEVLITLSVIGIITAVIIPVAIHSKPDENVMKFKKGHNTLYQVISTLVNSDKYYLDGNFAKRPDESYITGDNDGDTTYFCESFADVISTKSINCKDEKVTYEDSQNTVLGYSVFTCTDWENEGAATQRDVGCKKAAENMGAEIVSSDNITYYQASTITYGMDDYPGSTYLFLQTVETYNKGSGTNNAKGINSAYRCSKIFCMDIDGIGKGEDPFGYSIRADGQITVGTRAKEWLEKSIQGEN